MFICDSPLTGTYLGLIRESTWDGWYLWAEIRAYEFLPLAITTAMMSTNTMPNTSLINSLSFSMASSTERLDSDSVFSATSTGAPVYWMVDFGTRKNIGYALVVGSTANSNGQNWYVTFGDSPDPTANPTLYTAGIDWGKEVTI